MTTPETNTECAFTSFRDQLPGRTQTRDIAILKSSKRPRKRKSIKTEPEPAIELPPNIYKYRHRYQVVIQANGTCYWLGRYDALVQAKQVVDIAAEC